MQEKKRVLVTGANRGLGFGLVEDLFRLFPKKYSIILTSRDNEKGLEALNKIKQMYPEEDLEFFQLNICEQKSREDIYNHLKNSRQIDVLVNNAGICYPKDFQGDNSYIPSEETAINTINCNVVNQIHLTNLLLPLLKPNAKIIFVSSRAGQISFQPESSHQFFNNSENFDSANKIIEIAEKAIKSISKPEEKDELKWLNSAYAASKLLLNNYVRFAGQKDIKDEQSMYSMTPGWCKTDMGGENATKTVQEGNDTNIFLIEELPYCQNNQMSFKFIGDRKIIEW